MKKEILLSIGAEVTEKTVWNYGTEGAKISGGVAVIGTIFSSLLGGWDSMVQALIFFMVVDFALGFVASMKNQTTTSKAMLWGGFNKILVLVAVAMGVVLDTLFALPQPMVRTAIIWFYIGREGLSIVENYGKMGLPLPTFISKLLAQLKDTGDKGKAPVKVSESDTLKKG